MNIVCTNLCEYRVYFLPLRLFWFNLNQGLYVTLLERLHGSSRLKLDVYWDCLHIEKYWVWLTVVGVWRRQCWGRSTSVPAVSTTHCCGKEWPVSICGRCELQQGFRTQCASYLTVLPYILVIALCVYYEVLVPRLRYCFPFLKEPTP